MNAELCPSCGTHGGHAPGCPLLPELARRVQPADELTPLINDAVGWDDRKELADLWQDHAPLPSQGLTEGTYDALMHVAKWGARKALEDARDPDAIRECPTCGHWHRPTERCVQAEAVT